MIVLYLLHNDVLSRLLCIYAVKIYDLAFVLFWLVNFDTIAIQKNEAMP